MKYYFNKNITVSFNEAVQLTIEALKNQGFGIISEINLHEKLNETLDVDFKRYKILGICNHSYTYQALKDEDKIGSVLICNVLVIEQGQSRIEVAAINPIVYTRTINQPVIEDVAEMVMKKIKTVIQNL